MERWVIVNNGKVRGYFNKGNPTVEDKRMLVFGTLDDDRALEDEGEWVKVADPSLLVGDDWLYDGKTFSPPVR